MEVRTILTTGTATGDNVLFNASTGVVTFVGDLSSNVLIFNFHLLGFLNRFLSLVSNNEQM